MKCNNLVVLLLFISLVSIAPVSLASETGQSKAIFEVAWYDVGKAALDGQPGIEKVDKGWRKGREINTVLFDPEEISVESIERSLKKSGTYIRTVAD